MKNSILNGVVSVFVSVFIIFVFSACSESISKNEQNKALPSSTPTSVNQVLQRIEGAWDVPKHLGSESFDLIVDSYISGPSLLLNNSGSLFASWASHSEFDMQNNRYNRIQNSLFKFNLADVIPEKISDIPISNFSPILHFDETSGELAAFWQEQGKARSTRYQTQGQWQTPQDIAKGQWGDIVFDNQGDAVAIVVQQDGITSAMTAVNLSQGVSNNSNGVLQRNNGANINQVELILDTDKQSLIVWSETNNGVESLWSAEFSMLGGWHDVQQIPLEIDVLSSIFSNLTLTKNSTNAAVELFFSENKASDVSLFSISYRHGIWSTLDRLSQFNTLDVESDINTAVNDFGSMAIIWRELQQMEAQTYFQLKSRIFTPASGWSPAIPVSQSVPRSVGNSILINQSKPEISIDKLGNISASWIVDGQGRSELLVNHFDNSSGAWLTPELVVSYPITESSIADSSIVRGHDGQAIVAWQQKMKNPLIKEVHFWRSAEFGFGVLVDQPLQVSSSLVPLAIQPSAVWQTPLDVWSDTILSNTVSLIHGPNIEASDAGTGFISLYKNSDFDPLTGGYLRQESVILNNSAPGVWTADQPFPSTNGIASNDVQIKIAASGDAYALWLVDGVLYFNNFTSTVGWGTEVNLGTSDGKHDLLIDSGGNVWIFWVHGADIYLQQYLTGSGLQTADMTSISNAWYFAAPAIDANGVINVTWISLSTLGSQPFTNTNNLNLITYTPGTGWGFVEIAPPLNSFTSMGSELKLVPAANDEVIAISQDSSGGIFAVNYSGTNGWGAWENVDYNLDKSDHVAKSMQVASSGVNNVMVIWSEETIDLDGSPIYRIYSNRYDSVGDVNGIHWPAPERVGTIIPQFDSAGQQLKQFQTLPKIAILADGRAIATWLDSSATGSTMYANQYSLGTGWNNTPDQVISYDRLSTGIVKSPDVTVLANGKALLSWRQEVSTEFANEIHVWVTEGQL